MHILGIVQKSARFLAKAGVEKPATVLPKKVSTNADTVLLTGPQAEPTDSQPLPGGEQPPAKPAVSFSQPPEPENEFETKIPGSDAVSIAETLDTGSVVKELAIPGTFSSDFHM
jgi:hypothetical protein